ncbi:MAG: hypothetical protein UR26_C0003G0096 [candidate division TM6 bacterium GW2011_GWF2_32_72]|nr:MAG: hypothetical protein UR26_C0003G0096 [candidate division TM6 bacterium GW2011_GWF2_32_72]
MKIQNKVVYILNFFWFLCFQINCSETTKKNLPQTDPQLQYIIDIMKKLPPKIDTNSLTPKAASKESVNFSHLSILEIEELLSFYGKGTTGGAKVKAETYSTEGDYKEIKDPLKSKLIKQLRIVNDK